MRVANEAIFTNADMSGNLASDPIPLNQDYGYTIQVNWTGTAEVGTFKLQLSCDPGVLHSDGSVTGVTHWTDVDSSSQAISADGDLAWTVSNGIYNWARAVYTRTSGTGTLNGRFVAKGP